MCRHISAYIGVQACYTVRYNIRYYGQIDWYTYAYKLYERSLPYIGHRVFQNKKYPIQANAGSTNQLDNKPLATITKAQ